MSESLIWSDFDGDFMEAQSSPIEATRLPDGTTMVLRADATTFIRQDGSIEEFPRTERGEI